ncbi:MAG: hypothetical protein B7Z80_14845 [Rhodospirillales bacterium 20-64-7]|nr:MAG: hypothetical protein B7Z80_14845 [Rhodospirillales bacterium 20-64-7]
MRGHLFMGENGQEYILRAATQEHLALAEQWTLRDPFHCTTTPAAFWIEQSRSERGAGAQSYLLEDSDGPLFFFKITELAQAAIEMHIQFDAQNYDARNCRGTKWRTLRGLVDGFAWVEKRLAESSIYAVYFTSRNPALIRFCCERLKFEVIEGWTEEKLLRHRIAVGEPMKLNLARG